MLDDTNGSCCEIVAEEAKGVTPITLEEEVEDEEVEVVDVAADEGPTEEEAATTFT
jgi:hypothetical protein